MTNPTVESIAKMLDHAILQPFYTDEEMRREMEGLRQYPLASICIKSSAVALAVDTLAGSGIGVGTVIAFPHGASLTAVKALEASLAFDDGAQEVDMVINIGKALSDDWDYVREDIQAVTNVAHNRGGLIKVIFETGYLLEDRHKIRLCEICSEIGVDYVKTSTGFGFVKDVTGNMASTGARDHDLELMRAHSAVSVGVKASGGMRTLDDVLRVLPIGVTRIGTTSTKVILSAATTRFEGGIEESVSSIPMDY